MLQTLNLKKTATATVTAIALGATVLAASATAADAGKKKYHHNHGGAAAAAGVLGFATGLALGAGAYGGPYYGAPVVVGPDCYVEKVRRYNQWGQLVIVHREVCY